MHVLDFNHTHENYGFRPKTNTQRPQPLGASWHSYRMPGQMGGYHTGNPGCHRNRLWNDKSSQGRASITASLPATGCFCLSDFCSSRVVLRSNRLKMIFPTGSTFTATASLGSTSTVSSHGISICNCLTALLYDKLGLFKYHCFYPVSPSKRKRVSLKLRLFSSLLQFLLMSFAGLTGTHSLYSEHVLSATVNLCLLC